MVVCSGVGWLYTLDALEILGLEDTVGVIKLGTTWPLPIEFIWKYLQAGTPVLVIEEVDPFIEVHLKEELYNKRSDNGFPIIYGKNTGHVDNVGELNPDKVIKSIAKILGINYGSRNHDYDKKAREYAAQITLPRPPIWCAGCPHRASLWVLKFVLRLDGMEGFVTGDIGCYALDRYYGGWQLTQTQSCMGGGSGLASGFGKLQQFGLDQKVFANCGDSTFFHAAIPALINAVHHNSNATFMVLDNSTTGMTGFQPHPGTLLDAMGDQAVPIDIEKLCKSLGCMVEVADPFDLEDAKKKFWNLIHQEGAKVMIMRRKCALLAAREEGPQYRVWVDHKKCVGEECGCDRYCTRIFKCPGLIWDKTIGRAKIDEALCTGCGFCVNICPKSAIVSEKI
jgi:indolepyruvate ferredoxin oxidoreductase alpha subunit